MSTLTLLAGAALATLAMNAVAGIGESDEHDEDHAAVFGFVKDGRGAPVANAKVTARVKDGVTFSLTTGAAGTYRFPLLTQNVTPEDIVIACSKEGYKQTRVTKRPPPKGDGPKRIETECRLERG